MAQIADVIISEDEIPLSQTHPRQLKACATSHVWALGAIAELIDNAYDPDVGAKELYIDKEIIDGQSCLVFSDKGSGMDRDTLLKMLSFGYCEKDVFNTGEHKPIGQYGNGFKTGSMRLGKDVIVFTRRRGSAWIGLLSQTYLKNERAKTILLPIVEYKSATMQRVQSLTENNLDAILRYSPFKTEQALIDQLQCFKSSTIGTKIIIYNLHRLPDGREELDFESDPFDIRCPKAYAKDTLDAEHRIIEYVPEYRKSLREYCSILYFKPRMKIFIRKVVVKTKSIPRSLHNRKTFKYNPYSSLEIDEETKKNGINIVFGFSCEKDSQKNYGFMMYYKNRLIKPYEKIGCQTQNTGKGVGVIGVVQLDCLKPGHNKQEFTEGKLYNTVIKTMKNKLAQYWDVTMGSTSGTNDEINSIKRPDWVWVQCDACDKWRRLPKGTDRDSLPDKWFCILNEDDTYARCDTEEEPDHMESQEESSKKGKRSLGSSKSSPPSKVSKKMSKRKSLSQSRRNTSKKIKKSAKQTSTKPNAKKRSTQKKKKIKPIVLKVKTSYKTPLTTKRPHKSAITNKSQCEGQSNNGHSIEPRPGCYKDSDEPNSKGKVDNATQTEITYDKSGLTEFHKDVHRVLTFLVPKALEGGLKEIEKNVKKLNAMHLSLS